MKTNQPSLVDRINAAIQANDTKTGLIPRGKAPQWNPARTYFSPTDSYDDEIGPENPFHGFAPGAQRGMWNIADQQQASVPVTAITSSGNTKSAQLAAIQGGIAQNPQAATAWAAVPSLIQNLTTAGGPVQIQANVTVRSSAANDTAGFAIYRDGHLIGNHVTHTISPATVSAATLVQLTAMDNPPPGNHVYAMYWSPGSGTLVAVSNQRNFYAINLTPQG